MEPDLIIEAHEKYGLPLSFTDDGSGLITGGWDGQVSRWAVDTWSEVASITCHDRSVNCGAVAPDDHLVTGSTDTTVRVLDGELETQGRALVGHTGTVAGLAGHPAEPTVASASYDTTVRVWDLEDSAEGVELTGHPNNVTSVEFVDDGEVLVSGGIGDELIVWELADEREETRLGGHGQAVADIDGGGPERLWSVGYNGSVYEWSTEDWTTVDSFPIPEDATPSGIAVNSGSGTIALTRDGGILVYDTDGTHLASHATSIKGIYMPQWSPDGSVLVVGGADGDLRIYRPDIPP